MLLKTGKCQQDIQGMYAGTYKLALELIVEQVEIGQIDKVAELLGQLACKTSKMPVNIQCMYVGTYNRTCQRAVAQVERRNVVAKFADVRREREAGCVAKERNAYAV